MTDMLALDNTACKGIIPRETLCSLADIAIREQLPDGRRANGYVRTLKLLLIAFEHLQTHLPAITHIVVESLLAVMSEAVIIACNEHLHIQFLFQHIVHKLLSREGCELAGKGQNHHFCDAESLQLFGFLGRRREQLRSERGIEEFAGLSVEGDDHWDDTPFQGLVDYLPDEQLMPPVNAIKTADSSHISRFHRVQRY